MTAHDQRTTCSAVSDRPQPCGPLLGIMSCGAYAVGPHPDPSVGYRLPLCRRHLTRARVEWLIDNLRQYADAIAQEVAG